MRRPRVVTGWRLWARIGLFTFVFFLLAFCLAKITPLHGSRWDIPWTAVVSIVAVATAFVLLWTFLDSGSKG